MPSDMKKPLPSDKPALARHPFGPRPIGALLPAVTRTAFRKRSPATAALTAEWPSIVGPVLAASAHPRRLVAGTLTLGCTGPIALELQHLATQVIERINTHLGHPAVQRLRFMQEPTPSPRPLESPRRRPRLDPVAIDGLPDGELRDALAALGAEVLADQA